MPVAAMYGIQTLRARENFDLGGERLSDAPQLLVALAQVKVAAAQANRELGVLDATVAEAIVAAAREVAAGAFREEFPLAIVQGGGGTSTHMNMNEVLANRANEFLGASRGTYAPVHPLDHVNRSQSTNDVIPTAASIAIYAAARAAIAGVAQLEGRISEKALEFDDLEHLGRTCLQDAVPVPVAALHGAHAGAIRQARRDLEQAVDRLLAVPLGATAVGTGLGAPSGFSALAIRLLAAESGLPVRPVENLFVALGSLESFAAVAECMARVGRAVARVASDLRLLSSGPVGGIGEVILPPLQPGSSIMPGKVNPVLPELVMQVSFQLAGSAHVVALAAAAGELELAAMGTVVVAELLRGLARLERVTTHFSECCIAGLVWDRRRVASNLAGSLHGAVELAEQLGHEQAALSIARAHDGRDARTEFAAKEVD